MTCCSTRVFRAVLAIKCKCVENCVFQFDERDLKVDLRGVVMRCTGPNISDTGIYNI